MRFPFYAAALMAVCCVMLGTQGCKPGEKAPAPKDTGDSGPPPVAELQPAEDQSQAWTNSLGMRFVPVPGTDVLFSRRETRVQDYLAFASETSREWPKPDFAQGPIDPAVNVSWDDAKAFCQWLTEKERAAARIRADQTYRLPTDLEWSAAAGLSGETGSTPKERNAGIKDVYPWGTEWPPPQGAGNLLGEENRQDSALGLSVIAGYKDGATRTAPVGCFKPNQFGLYDLSGNVWEWCEDFYDGRAGERVLRGGSWGAIGSGFLLSSFRYSIGPGFRGGNGGFRCVLASSP